MTTEAQSIARRENGAKSRGPTTAAGKAISRLNAMKHGIYSEVTSIDGESDAELVALGKRLRADLAPVGELELILADKIVSTAWRLRRLTGLEASMFEQEEVRHRAFNGLTGERMLRLSRHEATLERALYRALHELQRLQASRNGQAVTPPEVVDVTVTSDEGAVGSFRQGAEIDGEACEAHEQPENRHLLALVDRSLQELP